jgi:hypothetical protein
MSKPTEVTVLCEDNLTYRFVRSYLIKCRVDGRNIRAKISRNVSGFTWVINQYPVYVNAYRLAKARVPNTWLIVVVDADKGTRDQRLMQLQQKLEEAEETRLREMRIEEERIARLIPRRNIETWLLALNNVSVDETKDYKKEVAEFRHYDWSGSIPTASKTFFDLSRPNVEKPENLIESLCHAIDEMRRVFQLAR